MKTYLTIILCFIMFPVLAQEHILIDCVHGADFSSSYNGPVPIDFQSVFPNDVLTVITPDSLFTHRALTVLVDTNILAGSHSYLINLPSNGIPEEVQTLYVVARDNTGNILNGIIGTITDPEYVLQGTLYNGTGHVDSAYGNGWMIQIQNPDIAQVLIGYGSTIFSGPAQYGLYDLSEYDAVLRIYDQYYLAYMSEAPDYSDTDLNAISNGLQNGLSFMHIFNYINTIVDKPFIHMYTKDDLTASLKVAVPGSRTLAIPKPTGNGHEFGWENMQLTPNSQNEHVYETALEQSLNFIEFDVSSTSISFRNKADGILHDLILIRSKDPRHYEIGMCSNLTPGELNQIKEWKTYTTTQAQDYLKNALYDQCIVQSLSHQEAYHFSYELPWIDVLLIRALKFPDQYFGLYRFDSELYNRLIPLEITPTPSKMERNMWVMVSNIQPRAAEATIQLNDGKLLSSSDNMKDFTYREYGMVDERYSMQNSIRETGFFGIDIFSHQMFHGNLLFYNNPFASELAGYLPSLVYPYWVTSFTVDNQEQYGIFHDEWDSVHPFAAAKRILDQGRVMVIGSSTQFVDSTQFNFLQSAMNSLIHSENLVTGNPVPPTPTPEQVKLSNYPNPFNPETTIQFSIPAKGKVEISLYNIKGQLIKQLISGDMNSGTHSVQWNGLNQNQESVASQVIFCRMHYLGKDYTKKLVLMK